MGLAVESINLRLLTACLTKKVKFMITIEFLNYEANLVKLGKK